MNAMWTHSSGFGVIQTRETGLERVNPRARKEDPTAWGQSVDVIAAILAAQRPRIVFLPHEHDWNSTHIGTHYLVLDALAKAFPSGTCQIVETEFWQAMSDPNLMIESSPDDVADLVAATSFHAGEVQRNPYHLGLPAWMMDNVRRGAELVGGQGGQAPDYAFATLYRVRLWSGGGLSPAYAGGKLFSAGDDLGALFGQCA